MNEEQIKDLVSSIVQAAEYDLWKEYFLEGYADEEDQESFQEDLIKVARKCLYDAGVITSA